MPQWAGSCWYYLRFVDPTNGERLVDPELEKYWLPVDLYVGGSEHAVLHLLYARFWHKVLYDAGIVSDAGAVPEARAPGHDPGRARVHGRTASAWPKSKSRNKATDSCCASGPTSRSRRAPTR